MPKDRWQAKGGKVPMTLLFHSSFSRLGDDIPEQLDDIERSVL